jgi:hypothetical protein
LAPDRPSRRGRTRGGLVSWPLYRLLAAVAIVPPLIALLTLRAPALPQPPAPPLQLDGAAATALAGALATAEHDSGLPCCAAGSGGELAGANWLAQKLHRFDPHPDAIPFATGVPGRSGAVPMTDVVAYRPGQSSDIVAVIAHRDGRSGGDASGTGLLLQLAATLAPVPRTRGLALVSTDGGNTGDEGAAAFARRWPLAPHIVAAIVIDDVAAAGGARLHLLVRPDTPRGTSPTVYAAARDAVATWYGTPAVAPGVYDQLAGYGIPYTTREQGALLARGIPAVTITAGSAGAHVPLRAIDSAQLGRVGTAIANLAAELDTATTIEPAGSPSIFLSGKVLRGWLAQVALGFLLAPVVACVLDMCARLRRRRRPIAPGVLAVAWRFGAWACALVTLWVEALLPGDLMSGAAVAPLRGATGASWTGIAIAAGAGLVFWRFASRPRLVRLEPVSGEERTSGLAGAMLAVAFASVLLMALDPFTLVLVLPAAHAWLAIPFTARIGRRGVLLAYAVGFAGPIALLWELAGPQGLGTEAPRALVGMTASGYLSPAVAVCLTIVAAATAQLGALVAGRYASPHPPRV